MHVYISEKKLCFKYLNYVLNVLNILIYNINDMTINIYMSIHIQYIYCMCVYLYIHNKCKQYTHIYYLNKKFILDAINRFIELVIS